MSSSGADMLISRHPKWYEIRKECHALPLQQRAAMLAFRVLRHAGVQSAPVPVIGIAQSLGVSLIAARLAPNVVVEAGVCSIIEAGGPTWRAVIRLSDRLSPMTQRRAVAHALGHVLMHDFPSDEFRYRDAVTFRDENELEWEANRFATLLLMPEYLIRFYASLGQVQTKAMANQFNVPSATMARRMRVF